MIYTIQTIYRANTKNGYAEFTKKADAEAYLAETQAAETAEEVSEEVQPDNK